MKKQFAVCVLMATFLMACTTSPYRVSLKVGDVINNKTVSIIEIGIAKQGLAYIPLIDAGIYNAVLASNAEALKAAQKEKNENLYEETVNFFGQIYNVETVKAVYPFGDEELSLNYFSESAGDDVKQQIIKICNENNTDYLITIMSQFATNSVGTFGVIGNNSLKVEISIFDRNGTLMGNGTATSTSGLALRANDISGFKNLYNYILESVKQLITELGT
ncbi:hypothetical protein AGMMS50293_30950 [Spirochaetia bacterium]|nr:hypothetical protein AGMMS50293_30950 [Spirochaetia bacterium]